MPGDGYGHRHYFNGNFEVKLSAKEAWKGNF